MFSLLLAFAAHADDATRARVVDLLSAYDTPPKAEDWRAVGPEAGAELFAIAQDTSFSHTRRAAAVFALGYFPTDTHRAWLTTLATTEGGDALLRRKAVHALANGWGEAALPTLATALVSADTQLRAAAARATARVGTPAATTLLRDRLAQEPDGMVHDVIARALEAK